MEKLGVAQANKEQAAIDRRRKMEEDRRLRVLNAKSRVMGVDRAALDAQVAAKKKREEEEKARDVAIANAQLLYEQAALAAEEEARNMRLEEARKLREFWEKNQKAEMRKEWDLNDPQSKLKEQPPRAEDSDDEDDWVGAASLQKFEGEDGTSRARARAQADQMRKWSQAQMAEKAAKIKAEAEAERLYQLQSIEMANRGMEMEAAAEAARRQLAAANAQYNLALARERKERDRDRKIEELQENIEEISNQLSSDVLTENPDAAVGLGGKTVVANYKGLSAQQLADIAAEQEAQIREKEALKAKEAHDAQEWERYSHLVSRSIAKQEMEHREAVKAERQAHLAELQRQADEKRRLDAKQRDEFTNEVTDDFYNKFGASSR